ncbi:DUF3301 domain-containing protein [Rheinheimera baltica]|uniref:DUF3301 domain-containing protein n=1 Tax=Rheinheimera baltica TaxID=67576 RepID=A0ABT9HYZ2_9GAMM|nr:DUF3301 domain-containing protein [Rheinheimera baltica]MDP5135901.1 DUF3301 domain-containing protein [Rheinheimera baltica]MDP5141768.1 DUF3301 domain-containing protein [Rheinheimera baltica]MDP5150251.1 DUF3301 domain-containing protein [Rheinheimera baltica]MDP5189441.1 DUF3301 domain-containing protein [Rheinheimera baltica]
MGSVLLLLVISTICYMFWLQRKQDERAIVVASQLCQQQQLQMLDCGRNGHSLKKINGKLRFITIYQVDFSGDGESRYQAELQLNGMRLAAFNLPAYRIN